MKKIKQELSIFFDIIKEYKVESIIIFLVGITCLVGFEYIDGISLTTYTIEFWDALFSGRILEFQQVLMENFRQAPHAGIGGNFIILFVWSIWNFPIWLINTFPITEGIISPVNIIYSNLFLYVVAVLVALQCYHIVYKLSNNKQTSRLAAVLFLGSGTLCISVGYSMQDEVQYLLTFLLALNCYLDGKKVQTILWLTLTTFLAPYMVLFNFIIFLHMDKNIWKIIRNMLITILPYMLIIKLLPIINDVHNNYFEWFMSRAVFQTGIGAISVLMIVLISLYVISYFKTYNSKQEEQYAVLYYLAIAFTITCVISWLHFYRYVICVPFLILAFFAKNRNESVVKLYITIFAIFETARFIGAIFFDENYLAPRYVSRMLANFVDNDLPSIVSFLKKLLPVLDDKILILSPIFSSIIFITAIILLCLMRDNINNVVSITKRQNNIVKIYCIVPLFVYISFFVFISRYNYTETDINVNSPLAEPLTNDVVFETFYNENSDKILNISIQPVTWEKRYPNDLKLCMDIFDLNMNETVKSYSVFANDLPNNAQYKFNTSDVKLNKSHEYSIRFYTEGTIENDNQYIYLLRTTGNENNDLSLNIKDIKENKITNTNYNVISNIISIR